MLATYLHDSIFHPETWHQEVMRRYESWRSSLKGHQKLAFKFRVGALVPYLILLQEMILEGHGKAKDRLAEMFSLLPPSWKISTIQEEISSNIDGCRFSLAVVTLVFQIAGTTVPFI